MIKNYFKIAFRNIIRHKTFSFINIAGLAVGMSSAIFIFLWIYNQVIFDDFHEKKDRIYSVWNRGNDNSKIICWDVTPMPLAPALQKDFPEIEQVARINFPEKSLFSFGEKRLIEEGCVADPTFLQIFSYPLVKGNVSSALNDPFSLVITEKFAQKLFGQEEAMGKTVKLDNDKNFTVTGVLKDLPINTNFKFEYLVSYLYLKQMGWENQFWGNNCTATYALLKPNVSLNSIESKVKDLRRVYEKDNKTGEFFLYPMKKWHLYGEFVNGKEEGGLITNVKFAFILAFFILLIACINFMNLSTARSEKRAKEVGIRKVVGAQKSFLIGQFIGESVLMSLIAGIIALVLVLLLLPAFSKFVLMDIKLDLSNPLFWVSFIGFIILTGLLAGIYPALFLSSFQPVAVLKGTFKKINALVTPRKALVVLQFTFASILIVGTIIVRQQTLHGINRDIGYSKDNLIYCDLNGDLPKNYQLLKSELLSSGAVTNMCKTFGPITDRWSNTAGIQWAGKPVTDKTLIERFGVDDNSSKTLGFTILQGRDFDLSAFPTDSSAVLLNETAVKLMGFKEPIGQTIKDGSLEFHIIGVVKDFIYNNPFKPVAPTVVLGAKRGLGLINMKLDSQLSTVESLKKMEAVFKKYNPEFPFDYKFADEEYAKKFGLTQRLSKALSLFSGLAIFISCLGLFGLATYMAENRIKEIGIRKVLGASVFNITALLSKDFLKLVLIANLIGFPIAYYFMSKWLQDFPYRIEIGWGVFVLTASLAILIAVLTVSFQAIKAAVANPVKSLRTE